MIIFAELDIYYYNEVLQKCKESLIKSCVVSSLNELKGNLSFFHFFSPKAGELCIYIHMCIKELYVFSCQETRPSSYAENLEHVKFRAVYLYVAVIQSVLNQFQKLLQLLQQSSSWGLKFQRCLTISLCMIHIQSSLKEDSQTIFTAEHYREAFSTDFKGKLLLLFVKEKEQCSLAQSGCYLSPSMYAFL